ncbi:MAG: mandelate racemase/muconate lactonizing enzyme family protein [Opitutaceae bacterium]|nr:mandelate racemase/muconate lactonizing enzyme family protein [Opitutaceae bacterium]
MSTIARVEAFVVSQPLRRPFHFSQWGFDRRAVCLVRVTTDDGRHGWGEGYGPADVVRAGVEFFAPHVLGGDPLRTGALWQRMHARGLDFGRRGVLLAALSAIDIALWDLKGKILGAPVHVLLGGKRRDAVAVYATGMYFDDEPDLAARLAAEAAGYAAQGFRAVKMKVGLGVETDAAHVRAVRAALGPRVKLMIDSNHAFGLREALDLVRRVEQHDIAWFEEPLSPDDYEGYRELRRRSAIPIAAGECEYGVAGFHQLFGADAVDIAQPDICACGGLTEVQRIAALARAHHVALTPHCWGTGIGFAVGLHFLATIDVLPGRRHPPEPFLEMDRTENALRDELTPPRFEARDGAVTVPDAPGLGIDVDLRRLADFSTGARSR